MYYYVLLCTRRKNGMPPQHKTKAFEFEARILIGWLANTQREPANQNTCLQVKHFCFYVKVACLSYGDWYCREWQKVSGYLSNSPSGTHRVQ